MFCWRRALLEGVGLGRAGLPLRSNPAYASTSASPPVGEGGGTIEATRATRSLTDWHPRG
jgi:hypothetical protein